MAGSTELGRHALIDQKDPRHSLETLDNFLRRDGAIAAASMIKAGCAIRHNCGGIAICDAKAELVQGPLSHPEGLPPKVLGTMPVAYATASCSKTIRWLMRCRSCSTVGTYKCEHSGSSLLRSTLACAEHFSKARNLNNAGNSGACALGVCMYSVHMQRSEQQQ